MCDQWRNRKRRMKKTEEHEGVEKYRKSKNERMMTMMMRMIVITIRK